MESIPFTKMHGLGNSYIYINTFEVQLREEDLSQLAIDVANKNTGIGSDGLILIHQSDKADVGMRMFNKDGSEGKTCGNGLRCVAKYAFEHNLVHQKNFTIETKAGNVMAEVHGDKGYIEQVTIDMGKPFLHRKDIPMLGTEKEPIIAEPFEVDKELLHLTAVSMGNPHAVFFVDDIEKTPLHELGPIITDDKRFPEGVNVEFVEIESKEEIHFRVWERGSGITQACGTGACAAVVATVLNGQAEQGQKVVVHLSGGDLTITWALDGHVWMTGPAQTTVSGNFLWEKED